MDELNPVGDILRRAQLISRLGAAAGLLAGLKYRDSRDAVLEAIEMIRALPVAEAAFLALQPAAMSNEAFRKHLKDAPRIFAITPGDDHEGSTQD